MLCDRTLFGPRPLSDIEDDRCLKALFAFLDTKVMMGGSFHLPGAGARLTPFERSVEAARTKLLEPNILVTLVMDLRKGQRFVQEIHEKIIGPRGGKADPPPPSRTERGAARRGRKAPERALKKPGERSAPDTDREIGCVVREFVGHGRYTKKISWSITATLRSSETKRATDSAVPSR